MAKPFPTFDLSREPTPASWREEVLVDPTIRTDFVSGAVSSRARFTTAPLKRISFVYNWLTQADKVLIENFQNHVAVGASKFDFRNPITDEDWEMRFLSPIKIGIESRDERTYSASIEMYGKEVQKMRVEHIAVEDLGAGVDISNRPFFVNPKAVTINSIGILTKGSPAGVDDSNTVVLAIEDDASNAVVSKTYDASPQPPSSDYEDLGQLANQSLLAGEHLLFSLTQGATANMPAFDIVVEYYYTP